MNGNLISKKEFGDRVYFLRDQAGYGTPRELALVICGYSKDEKGLMGEDAKAVDRMRRNIQNWEVGKNIPSASMVATLCNLLDCDPDYLLYSECTEPRKEIRSVMDITGLSSSSVKVLQSLMKRAPNSIPVTQIIETINLLLENTDESKSFFEIVPLLENISAYIHCSPLDERIVSVEEDGKVKIYDNEMSFEAVTGEVIAGARMNEIVKTSIEQRVMSELRNMWNEKNGESRLAFHLRMLGNKKQHQ